MVVTSHMPIVAVVGDLIHLGMSPSHTPMVELCQNGGLHVQVLLNVLWLTVGRVKTPTERGFTIHTRRPLSIQSRLPRLLRYTPEYMTIRILYASYE